MRLRLTKPSTPPVSLVCYGTGIILCLLSGQLAMGSGVLLLLIALTSVSLIALGVMTEVRYLRARRQRLQDEQVKLFNDELSRLEREDDD